MNTTEAMKNQKETSWAEIKALYELNEEEVRVIEKC